jgi:tripartite-type tricarboxylate transporter receptor subunit TctC
MNRLVFLASAVALAATPPVFAQPSSADFSGKSISLYIGNSVGGGYDLYARAVARHMAKHIPGAPAIIPKNMEGGGSLRAANFMAELAPRDGTAMATIGRGTVFSPLMGQAGANFDATALSWIGSANNEVSACVAWHTSGVASFEDLKRRDLILATTVATDDATQLPKLLNGIFGTRFKVVLGYPGGTQMNKAMESGEAQGRCGLSWGSFIATHPHWVEKQMVKPLFQVALERHPAMPDVPLLSDYATTDEQKQMLATFVARQVMGRPFFAPQAVPSATVKVLRDAFDATMSDGEFLAEAKKTRLEINPVSGARVQELVAEIYRTPRGVIQKMIELSK